MKTKDIRWEQRFQNLEKAYLFFEKNVNKNNYSLLEELWLLHSFEFTFELSWKTLKDYLENEWIIAKTPRESIKEAFNIEIIKNWKIWLEMLEKRNELTHIYDEWLIDWAIEKIQDEYYLAIKELYNFFKSICKR